MINRHQEEKGVQQMLCTIDRSQEKIQMNYGVLQPVWGITGGPVGAARQLSTAGAARKAWSHVILLHFWPVTKQDTQDHNGPA